MSDGSYLCIWKVVSGRTPVCQKHHIYIACKTRQEHPENEVGKNVTGLENEVGTPRQLRYVTNMVRSSYIIMFGEKLDAPRRREKHCPFIRDGRCGHKEWAKTMLDGFLWIDLLLDLPNMDLLNGFLWVYSWFLWPAVTMVFLWI